MIYPLPQISEMWLLSPVMHFCFISKVSISVGSHSQSNNNNKSTPFPEYLQGFK